MRARPDAIVFDVDGVLVETEASYGEAVVRTVQWLLSHDGVRDNGPAIDRATVRLWKREGSWNNDWDLANGMYCWLVSAEGATTRERRHAAAPATEAARSSMPDLERRAGQLRRHSWNDVRGVLAELYEGTSEAVARYAIEAKVWQPRGLKHNERILLEPGLIDDLARQGITKVGIVTGRDHAEWTDVRARLPLPAGTAVATDEDGRKPDTAPLRKVASALRPRAFVTVGDTMDDLIMALRWNGTDEGASVPAMPVTLCPLEDESTYRLAGAQLFIRNLDDLPRLLRGHA